LFSSPRSSPKQKVVTGSTDGIGRQYAKELAGQGMNIVLISRTESKLIEVAKEIGNERATDKNSRKQTISRLNVRLAKASGDSALCTVLFIPFSIISLTRRQSQRTR
jgi:short-subunit dehydrogenase